MGILSFSDPYVFLFSTMNFPLNKVVATTVVAILFAHATNATYAFKVGDYVLVPPECFGEIEFKSQLLWEYPMEYQKPNKPFELEYQFSCLYYGIDRKSLTWNGAVNADDCTVKGTHKDFCDVSKDAIWVTEPRPLKPAVCKVERVLDDRSARVLVGKLGSKTFHAVANLQTGTSLCTKIKRRRLAKFQPAPVADTSPRA